MKHCVLAAAGVKNDGANYDDADDDDHIIFTIKDTKLYVPVVTLSSKDNQKLSKLLSKGYERYWNEHKIKSESKNTTNKNSCFLESENLFE